jgi:hypothetical protein
MKWQKYTIHKQTFFLNGFLVSVASPVQLPIVERVQLVKQVILPKSDT